MGETIKRRLKTSCWEYYQHGAILVLLIQRALGDEVCSLCPGDGVIPESFPAGEKDLFVSWPVSVSNCQELMDYAVSLESDSQDCNDVHSISTVCGCPVSETACKLCPTTNSITRPEKDIGFLSSDFGGVPPTCQTLQAFLHSIDASSMVCFEAMFFGTTCGCPSPNGIHSNSLCPDGSETQTPNKVIPQFGNLEANEWSINPPTCQLIEALLHQNEVAGSTVCSQVQNDSFLCGCPGRNKRLKILAWLPRISAPLSLFGSLFIIYDIFKKNKSQRTTQHHLLVGMSLVDCLSSIAWALSTLPIPETDEYGNPTPIYGARGTEATCKAQGFFIQFGLTSPFYNLILALYYMLIICYNWTEDKLKRVRWFMYLLPLVVGLGLALGALPFYNIDVAMCFISPGKYRTIFVVIPLCIVIVMATTFTGKVYWNVYYQERRARRWTRGSSNVQNLPRKVFWQSFWYLFGFFVAWPILIVSNYVKLGPNKGYWFLCLTIFVAPIQGFLNFITYTRLRFQKFLKRHNKCCCCSLRKQNTTQGETEPEAMPSEAVVAVNTEASCDDAVREAKDSFACDKPAT